ncbi:hypothetical protein [Roseinatronobacter alkalisoli]|uniref:Uncharacterized protein n=1 Tax=Roseinatronobacter alkalisoli TaxID=3028235 RepID=A0ABT5TFI4_9RHOB|nr:hypothetical protein [Roseinatronobacter sp. HJB301]MDD7973890.1 hypothetical protein [Roseinatronobacter sp. HJB301]
MRIKLPAASKQREGQVLAKLIFDVGDVEIFCAAARAKGLEFCEVHKVDGYAFAHAKDPSKNSRQVSRGVFAASYKAMGKVIVCVL